MHVYREVSRLRSNDFTLVLLAITGAETVAQKQELTAARVLILFSLLAATSSAMSLFIECVCLQDPGRDTENAVYNSE